MSWILVTVMFTLSFPFCKTNTLKLGMFCFPGSQLEITRGKTTMHIGSGAFRGPREVEAGTSEMIIKERLYKGGKRYPQKGIKVKTPMYCPPTINSKGDMHLRIIFDTSSRFLNSVIEASLIEQMILKLIRIAMQVTIYVFVLVSCRNKDLHRHVPIVFLPN